MLNIYIYYIQYIYELCVYIYPIYISLSLQWMVLYSTYIYILYIYGIYMDCIYIIQHIYMLNCCA